jgi:glycosyltransferase involved in cell wall biosynthesis
MNIVLFTHPEFLNSTSMPLFAKMIFDGMAERGHQIVTWSPKPFFYRLPAPRALKKWFGYIDQYVVFPFQVRWRLHKVYTPTMFVFSDQGLGPWVPLVKNKLHVIHCHDFMALGSALGEYPQNRVSFTGRLYQSFIRHGFSQGKYFLSVSKKTCSDLHRYLSIQPNLSAYVYNGLSSAFFPMEKSEARHLFAREGWHPPQQGFLLHVGGNQWYKNRLGVVRIYHEYCKLARSPPLPLCLIGAEPTHDLRTLAAETPDSGEVVFLSGVSTEVVQAGYCLARLFIFPSLSEGFGWPIAEALVCGCPVVTTGEAPMTEVGGDACAYLPVMPSGNDRQEWAFECAQAVRELLDLPEAEKVVVQEKGFKQALLFDRRLVLDKYEEFYQKVLHSSSG